MGSTWIIGDIHGCAATFELLLERIELDLRRDRLVLTGDLVNRGPHSLAVLRRAIRLARDLGARFETVLGNHDLHLLAIAAGVASPRRDDTLDEVLAAPDRDELLSWLRQRPLLVEVGDTVVVHAGLHPLWSWDEVAARARRLEARLRDERMAALVTRSGIRGDDQLDLAIFTRLRAWNTRTNSPEDGFSGPPEKAPSGCVAWYEVPSVRERQRRVVFGHWAAHGRRIIDGGRVVGLDSGCAWGGELSALRLEDMRVVAQLRKGR